MGTIIVPHAHYLDGSQLVQAYYDVNRWCMMLLVRGSSQGNYILHQYLFEYYFHSTLRFDVLTVREQHKLRLHPAHLYIPKNLTRQ